jgi:hypothetical protein
MINCSPLFIEASATQQYRHKIVEPGTLSAYTLPYSIKRYVIIPISLH